MAHLRIIVALALVVAWWQKDTLDDRALTHEGPTATIAKSAARLWMAATPPSPAKEWIRARDEWLDGVFNPQQDYSSPVQELPAVVIDKPSKPLPESGHLPAKATKPVTDGHPTTAKGDATVAPVHPAQAASSPATAHPPTLPESLAPAVPNAPTSPASAPTPPASSPELEPTAQTAIKRILVVGDSMSGDVGMSLRHLAAKHKKQTGVDVQIIDAHRHSTGLVVPSYYDWPRELPAILKKNEPQAVVFMVGANDGQSMRLANQSWVAPGAPGWSDEYQRRVKQVAETIPAASKLVWLDLPPVRLKSLQEKTSGVNGAVNAALASCTHCVHLETRSAFGGNTYVENEKLRARDGVHYARSGSALVAAKVWSNLGLPVYD